MTVNDDVEHRSKRLRNELVTELVAFSVLVASVSLLWRNNPLSSRSSVHRL